MHSSPTRPNAVSAAGLALLAPALVALVVSLVWPTLWTLWTSLQRANLLTSARFVGGDNYGRLLTNTGFWHAVGLTVELAVAVVVAAGVLPPLLAFLVDAGGRRLRLAARLVLSPPMAFFAPAAGAGAWLLWLRAPGGDAALSDPLRAPAAIVGIVVVSGLGVACGAGLMVFLAALRGRPAAGVTPIASLAGWGLLVMAGAAAAVQSFVPSFVLTGGGPRGATLTPSLLQYQLGFQRFDFGGGTAVASLTLLVLAVLGVAATVLAVWSGLRVELGADASPATRPAGNGPAPAAVLGVLALAVAAGIALYGGWPRLAAAVAALGARPVAEPYGQVLVNTVVPPLLSAVVQVAVAFVAALGIGGLRPLGARSEWLLLPFAPWLFVGTAPLSLAGFAWERAANLYGTFPALIPPILVSVPALFVLTLCCRGQAPASERLVAGGAPPTEAFLRAVVLPVLPMFGLLVGATALVGMQDLLWPLLVVQSPDRFTLPVLMTQLAGQFAATGSGVALVVTLMALPGVVALAGLTAAQVLYLDRLQLRAGRAS
jgi:ABC-type sugar transport system permease subunit